MSAIVVPMKIILVPVVIRRRSCCLADDAVEADFDLDRDRPAVRLSVG